MKVRKAIKKIAALGAGITMMGATLLGATAASDLTNYPDMFIENGQFDGYFVVGDNAASADVVGAINVATRMQFESKRTSYVSTGAEAITSVSDGVKFDKSSEHLYLDSELYSIETEFDETDLPVLLGDGNYDESEGNTDNDEDYTQKVSFTTGANAGEVVFAQDDQDAPNAGWYLLFDDSSSSYMYTYELEFDNDISYDTTSSTTEKDDLEGTELTIQGQAYTIVKADFSSDVLDKLTLMAGDTVIWVQQQEVITKVIDGVEHEIEMVDVTENEDACGFKVDGSTVWVDVDETETKNGVTIGVLDAKAVHNADNDGDICKINIGASELVLEDGKEVKLEGTDIDGSNVVFNASSAGNWDKLTITYVPDDNIYLAPDDEFVDPIFGNFKFVVGNVIENTEDMSMTTSGDDAELNFVSNDNKDITIPFYHTATANGIRPGDGPNGDDFLYLDGETCDLGASDVRDCEGATFLAISTGNEPHIYEIKNIDTTDDKIDFKDLTYGAEDNENAYTDGTVTSFSLSVGSISLTITDNGGVDFNSTFLADYMETSNEAKVFLNTTDYNTTVIWEKDDDSNVGGSSITLDLTYDYGNDDRVEISPITVGGNQYTSSTFSFSDENDNDKFYVTDWGTTVLYDDEERLSAEIVYPETPSYLEVYFAPTGSALTEGASEGEVTTYTPQQISVQAAKLASEISNVKAINAIVVGGPCANSAAAALLDNPANCAEGFEAGHAKIKLFENNGMYQLLVAGYSAEDSRRATTVLAEFENYAADLVGDEVDVTGTSLSDISVGEPMVADVPETTADNTEAPADAETPTS